MSEPLTEAVLEYEADPSASSGLDRSTIDRIQSLLEQGALDDATTLLDDSLREEGSGTALRALRAKLDYLAGHFSSAALRYAAVAAEAEDIPALRIDEALCLLRASRHDDAFEVLFGLLSRGVQSPRLWGYLGVALEHRGQHREAAAAYLAGGHATAAQRMRRRKLDSMLAREGAARLDEDELVSSAALPASEVAPATRGIEALRDANQRTSPPEPFAHGGLTELPHSFGDHLADTSSEAPGPTGPRPARTLLDLTLASLLVVPADVPWSRHESGLVCASAAAEGPIYYDTRAFVARARPSAESPGPAGASKGFTKAEAGRVVLGPRGAGETLHLLDLAGEGLVVHDRYVVAFDVPGTVGAGMPVRHAAPWPLEMLEFSGEGMLVLGLPETLLTYDVRSGDHFELRAASLIGWAGELEVTLDDEPAPAGDDRLRRILGDDPSARGDARRVRFSGNGTVLLLTRPFALTSPMIPRAGGSR